MSMVSRWILAGLVACSMLGGASESPAASRGLTMFVVPARYQVLKVMFDVAARRDVVLVSYQTRDGADRPLLHAWNGEEWVYVSPMDFRDAKFLKVRPSRVVLVGEAGNLPPLLAEASNAWCPVVMNVTELTPSALVNSAGRLLDFKVSEYEWFARQYNMTMTDANAARRQGSWYDGTWAEREAQMQGRATTPPAPAPVEPAAAPVVEPAPAVPVAPVDAAGLPVPPSLPAEEPKKVEPAAASSDPAAVTPPAAGDAPAKKAKKPKKSKQAPAADPGQNAAK